MPGVSRRVPIRKLLATAAAEVPVEVTGWVKTSRFSKNVSFVHVMDGSGTKTVQVVLSAEQAAALQHRLGVGAAVRVRGTWKPSPAAGQPFEVHPASIDIVGDSDAATYPLQKKATSFEHLRTIAHLRPRTNTFQSVFRVRNALSWQIHRFFQERGFLWVHTPIVTAADAEGAGEMFAISTAKEEEFFGKPAMLTVSGQLEVETFCQAFSDVYTFGPTFRAENSNTPRHAAEFWMIEPEIAFGDLDDLVALAEEFVREVALAVHAHCPDDFAFFEERIEKGVVDKVVSTVTKPFAKVTYTEAQEILVAAARGGKAFEYPVGWGSSMQAEHERFLAEEHFRSPVFVTHYPRSQKSFYMRIDGDPNAVDERTTVACTDLLVPRVGEIIGGSQREERHDVLVAELARRNMEAAPLWWYLDLRRWGSVPHAGFGLGLERMLLWMTGMQNIRDAIPFPRTPGNAEF
jgi:asparaginyl-tRNA synthetase